MRGVAPINVFAGDARAAQARRVDIGMRIHGVRNVAVVEKHLAAILYGDGSNAIAGKGSRAQQQQAS